MICKSVNQFQYKTNKSYHLRSLYSCIFYYNIKTVTFMGFDIPIPNFINSTIDIYDFPEKIMGNGINERMLYLCLLRLPSKESSNILITSCLQHQPISLYGQMVKWSNIFLRHPIFSHFYFNNNIYKFIYIYYYWLEPRKKKGVCKKCLTIWPFDLFNVFLLKMQIFSRLTSI